MVPERDRVGYEVHVTCASSIDAFSKACKVLGVKPVHAHNMVGDQVVSTELLSQSSGFGTKEEALAAMRDVGAQFRAAGLVVVREKVELDPKHPDAPHDDHEPDGTYFEAHLRVEHAPGRRSKVLATRDALWERGIPLWASYNTLKRVAPGTEVTMLTARSYTMGLTMFRTLAQEAQAYVSTQYPMRPLVVEWAIADNNTELDRAWLVQ